MKTKIILTALSTLMVLGCADKNKEVVSQATSETKVTLTKAQLVNTGLKTEPLQERTIEGKIRVNGKIILSPESVATVTMPLGGYIRSVKVMPGMPVSKGQVLAVLEDQQYIQLQQDYLTVKQQLIFAQSDFKRQKELNMSKAVSDKSAELAENELNKNRILLKSLEEKLKMIGLNPAQLSIGNLSKSVTLRSPLNGFISKVAVNLGQYINASDVVFEVTNDTNPYLQLVIFEKDASQLKPGQKIRAFSNTSTTSYDSQIVYLNKKMDANNAIEALCKIQTHDQKLMAGTYMNAEISGISAQVVCVPNSAIQTFEDKTFVFIKRSDLAFEMVEVKVGVRDETYTEIIAVDELKGKQIVTQGAYTLLMMLKNKEE